MQGENDWNETYHVPLVVILCCRSPSPPVLPLQSLVLRSPGPGYQNEDFSLATHCCFGQCPSFGPDNLFVNFFSLLLICSMVLSYPAAAITYCIETNTGLVCEAPSSFPWTSAVDHTARRKLVSSTDHCCLFVSMALLFVGVLKMVLRVVLFIVVGLNNPAPSVTSSLVQQRTGATLEPFYFGQEPVLCLWKQENRFKLSTGPEPALELCWWERGNRHCFFLHFCVSPPNILWCIISWSQTKNKNNLKWLLSNRLIHHMKLLIRWLSS